MTLRDQTAREAIAHALDKNLMVLAGAGAGKTYALVQRMVNAVCTGAADVEHMAAITFTRKAAGEMRGRFFLELRKRAKTATGDEADRIRHALAHIDQGFIGTIHSFCGTLLRQRPMAAGLPPEFSEVEDREEAIMRRKAWDGFVQRGFLSEDPRLEQCERLGLRPEDLYAFFHRRCLFSDLRLKPTSVQPPDLNAAAAQTIAFLDQVEASLPNPLPGKRDGLQTALLRARLLLKNRGLHTDADRLTFLEPFSGNLSVTLKDWAPNQAMAKHLRDEALPNFRETVLAPVLTQWRHWVYQHVAPFVDDAVAAYAVSRRSSGRLTFQDLLELAAHMLRTHPSVRRHFQNRFRCLCIDEFQDTDPIQAEVLLYLTGENPDEPDWQKCVPRPGSLFLVGDEKQSIYRFRRADVETFRFVRDRVSQSGGDVIQLNTSFRALGHLCDWINAAFEPLFAAHNTRYQAGFSPLFKVHPDGTHTVRKIPIGRVNRHNRGEIATQDAERIADFIAAAIAGQTECNGPGEDAALPTKASPGDFLIITRTSTYLTHYAHALEQRGIPFDLTGGSRLGDAREVRAVSDVLDAICAPDNPLPLLAYLRGDLVGLSDDTLYAFKKAGGHFDYTQPVPDTLPHDVARPFKTAFEHLRHIAADLRRMPPAAALERGLNRLGLMPFVRAQPMGATRAGNLMRLLSLIRTWQHQGMHQAQIAGELRILIDDPDDKTEQMSLDTGREDVVRLMNLHQCKGLQSRVVFLADPCDTSPDRHGPDFHVSRIGSHPFLSMPVRVLRGQFGQHAIAEPEGWTDDEAEETRFLSAEALRLLYVAATRAENLLVVSTYEGDPERGPWAPLYPALADAPELPHCPAASVKAMDAPAIDLERQRKDRDAFWNAAGKLSDPVKADDEDRPESDDDAQNIMRDIGIAIHRLFDAAISNRLPDDPAPYIRYLIPDPAHASQAQNALAAFRASALWTEIQSASAVHAEVPLVISRKNGPRRGVIDLVYRLPNGWKIVDYKTHAVNTDAEIQALIAQSRPQLIRYAKHWAAITGEPVITKGLWLTAIGAFVPVP